MKFFKKKETAVESIAFMGMFGAINAVLCVLASFFPLGGLLLLLVIPLSSMMVALFCPNRYYLIYLGASIPLCLLASLADITAALFYALPGLFTGGLFGLLMKRGSPFQINLFACGVLQFLFFLVEIPLIKTTMSIDMQVGILTFFRLNENEFANLSFFGFMALYSILEMTLICLFAFLCFPALGIEYEAKEATHISAFCAFGLSVAGLIIGFFNLPIGFVFSAYSLYWCVLLIADEFKKTAWWYLIASACVFVLSIIFFALGYQYDSAHGLNYLNFFPMGIGLVGLIRSLLLLRKKGHKSKM